MTQLLQFRFCATKYMVRFLLSLIFSILKFLYKDLKVKAVEQLIGLGICALIGVNWHWKHINQS